MSENNPYLFIIILSLGIIENLYDIMNEQVYRAAKLVSNVRKLSQIKDSQVALKIVDLYKILEDSINFLKQSLQNMKL